MANSTPFQTTTSANMASPVLWKDSEAKKVLVNDIASGFVTDGMAAKEVYNDKRQDRFLLLKLSETLVLDAVHRCLEIAWQLLDSMNNSQS
jgi:hypothetical protein